MKPRLPIAREDTVGSGAPRGPVARSVPYLGRPVAVSLGLQGIHPSGSLVAGLSTTSTLPAWDVHLGIGTSLVFD